MTPQLRASATSDGRALPAPRAPIWTIPFDPGHLRCAPHVARQAETLALNLIAPVDVCIELEDGDRAVIGIRIEAWDRHRIIATQNDGDGACIQNCSDTRANHVSVLSEVCLGDLKITPVDSRRISEERALEIEVVVVAHVGPANRSPNRARSFRAVRAHRLIRRGRRGSHDDDVGVACLTDWCAWQVEEATDRVAAEDVADS